MVSMDISLTPSLPGATLSLSSSLNKRVLGDYMRVCFFGRLRLRQKEGVTRISKSKRDRLAAPSTPLEPPPKEQQHTALYSMRIRMDTLVDTHSRKRRLPPTMRRRPHAAPAGPGATSHHPQASPGPLGAASEPLRRINGRNFAFATGTRNRHQNEGAATRPNDHAAAVHRGPSRSAHGTLPPVHAAALHGRLGATAAARERCDGLPQPARGARWRPCRRRVGDVSAACMTADVAQTRLVKQCMR
jgi:hypothetical protein